MATWTELLDPSGPETRTAVLPAADLREMLLDLPNHPNICRVVCVSLRLDNGAEVKVGLDSLAPDKRMASGSTGPVIPGAAAAVRDTVQPWRVTPVLGDAGLSDEAAAALERLRKAPREWDLPKVETAPAGPMDRLIILPGDA